MNTHAAARISHMQPHNALRPIKALLRRMGFDVVRFRLRPGQHHDAHIVTVVANGRKVSFLVLDRHDQIQSHHFSGTFYEPDELQIIARHFPAHGTFVDVGANIGNHSIYAALVLDAKRVIAIEPNPAAYRILCANAGLNGILPRFTHYAVGLSSAAGHAVSHTPDGNLGGTSLVASADGDITLVRGDDLLRDEIVDFIKIDAEGMELEALQGLGETIDRQRPVLFVEVDDDNATAFQKYLDELGYTAAERFRRYPVNENILAVPR